MGALWKFETKKFYFTIIDAPGHRDFIKNMITGTSQADVAILMIAVKQGEFEAGWGAEGSTKEHMTLANTLGVKKLIVCMGKMDGCGYNQGRFDEVRSNVKDWLKKKNMYKKAKFIPISGLKGDNLIEKSTNMSWYEKNKKYCGKTLLEILDTIKPPKAHGQAAPSATPGRVQDPGYRNGPGRPCRNWCFEAWHEHPLRSHWT